MENVVLTKKDKSSIEDGERQESAKWPTLLTKGAFDLN